MLVDDSGDYSVSHIRKNARASSFSSLLPHNRKKLWKNFSCCGKRKKTCQSNIFTAFFLIPM